MGQTVLEMIGIKKSFSGIYALSGIDFSLELGEVHALLGENGAGKSTLIKVLGGIYQPDSGIIKVNGKEVKINGVPAARENGIGIIHQEIVLVPYLSVAQNLFLGREIRRGNRYDGIILDPPSYGRGTNGEMWKLEDSICDLMNMCTEVLTEKPLFIVLNSYTTGLSSSVMTYLLQMTVGRKYKIRVDSQEIGLPVEQTGLAVPAGNTAVVYFD